MSLLNFFKKKPTHVRFSLRQFHELLSCIEDARRECSRRHWCKHVIRQCKQDEIARAVLKAAGEKNDLRSKLGGAVAFWFENQDEMVIAKSKRVKAVFKHFFNNGPEPKLR